MATCGHLHLEAGLIMVHPSRPLVLGGLEIILRTVHLFYVDEFATCSNSNTITSFRALRGTTATSGAWPRLGTLCDIGQQNFLPMVTPA